MRVLTDCPAEAVPFAGPAPWTPVHAARLPDSEARIWRALDGAPTVAEADVATPGPESFWALLTVQREAPRSQYDALHEALAGGLALPGPTACVALGGRGFHGQHGRSWTAERGNLFLTVALAPCAPAARLMPGLVMLPVVAVAEAIDRAGDGRVDCQIKWVNDVLLGGRKVGGTLVATHVRGDVLETVVLGIGVNVARAPDLAPTPFVPEAGCLRDAGIAIDAGGFLHHVLERLAHRYRDLLRRGPGPLLETYRARSVVLGRRVRLCDDRHATPGPGDAEPGVSVIVRAIEPDLSLRIEGRAEPVSRGRLRLEPATGGRPGARDP